MHFIFTVIFTLLSFALAAPSSKAHGRYIVKFKHNVSQTLAGNIRLAMANTPTNVYSMAGFEAFAGILSTQEVARLEASDHVCHLKVHLDFKR
jgi:hypothetical protein